MQSSPCRPRYTRSICEDGTSSCIRSKHETVTGILKGIKTKLWTPQLKKISCAVESRYIDEHCDSPCVWIQRYNFFIPCRTKACRSSPGAIFFKRQVGDMM